MSGHETPAMQRPIESPARAIIDNRTDLPDADVQHAVMAHFVESAGLQFGQPSMFQMYSTNQGQHNLFNRSSFRTPGTVIDEIRLARQIAEHDDDVRAVIHQCLATAFGDGMENHHEDEKTLLLFNKICGPSATGGMNMDAVLPELYREYLIAGQVNSLSLFTRTRYKYTPQAGTQQQEQLTTPSVGILPAENIRVLTNDVFGSGTLAYDATTTPSLYRWLTEFFATSTSAAKKNAMAQEEPVMAALFTGVATLPSDSDYFVRGTTLFTLNPRMVQRTTMPKGSVAYPTPPLTSNFALLEAKRLLNIMDYAILQGGTNYIVVAKTGSDKLPAQQPEVDNLTDQVRGASRSGVLVGDHRVSIEIITPDLKEVLNPAKRKLLGRKIAMALLRVPEQVTEDSGNAGAGQELEFTARSITFDRRAILRHVEGNVYQDIVTRNGTVFSKGAPSLWCPKIVLSDVKDFLANVTQARDRGDIPRKYAVEALGYNYEAAVAQRKREKANGDDEVLTPGAVPFAGDPGGQGRPPGTSPDNGRPGASPAPGSAPHSPSPSRAPVNVPQLQHGSEAVLTTWDGERTMRYGELTAAVLDQYPENRLGRMSAFDHDVVASEVVLQRGATIGVPLNPSFEVNETRIFRLDESASLVVGQCVDNDALVAKALVFHGSDYTHERAVEEAMRWGFVAGVITPPREVAPEQQVGPTADEIVASATSAIAAAMAGANLGEMLAGVQEAFAVSVATAVAAALKEAALPAPAPAPPAAE